LIIIMHPTYGTVLTRSYRHCNTGTVLKAADERN
jgi:hypothetical protein